MLPNIAESAINRVNLLSVTIGVHPMTLCTQWFVGIPAENHERDGRDDHHAYQHLGLIHRHLPLNQERLWDQPNTRTTATTIPVAPQIAMTVSGLTASAAAPARIMTAPCPRLIPPCAIPKA
jgi:hypothetical protein